FIGEFTILKGAYEVSFMWALGCGIGILLGAAYLIWLFQRTAMGEAGEASRGMADLSLREIAVAAPLLAGMFWIGLYPKPFFDLLVPPAQEIVNILNGVPAQSGVLSD